MTAPLAEGGAAAARRRGWNPLRSAKHAFGGLAWIVARGPSLRFGAVASAAAVGLGLLLRFNLVELALLVLSLTVVLAAEIVNTSIEMLCDELRPEPDQAIGRVKDVAAAATAMSEIGLAIVGVLLIARHLLPWLAP